MVLELVGYDEIRYNRRKDEIKCRLCKSGDTKISSEGERIWVRDKNVRGDWIGQFLCYDCYYKQEKVCCKCGADQITKSAHMFRHYDKGIWTGKYICQYCHSKDINDYKNRNIILNVIEGGGSILDVVISKVLDIPTYSIYIADKRLPFSLIHEYYGIIGIKTSRLRRNYWNFNINDYISADTYFLMGFDEELKNIQVMYIVPSEKKINGNGRLNIHKNSIKYKEFMIDHEPYNDIYTKIR